MAEYQRYVKCWNRFVFIPVIIVFYMLNSGDVSAEPPTLKFSEISAQTYSLSTFHLCPGDASVAPEVILIPKAKSWLISLLLPYLRCNQNSSRLPVLLVFPDKYAANFDRLLESIKNRNILSFLNPKTLAKDYRVQLPRLKSIRIEDAPFKASQQLAKYFPHSSTEIVLTVLENSAHFIHASLLAAHFSIPMVLFQSRIDTNALQELVTKRNIQKIHLIADDDSNESKLSLMVSVNRLSLTDVNLEIVRQLGADKIRNLIVTNPFFFDPKGIGVDPDLIYYAPYISLLRKSPLVLFSSNKGSDAEIALQDFIHKYKLSPTTITLIGDYSMISTVDVDEKLKEQIFKKEMELEPLSYPTDGKAIPFGIGRLPFSKIDCLSMYYARLKERERTLNSRFPRFTMIANLKSDKRKKLMLAESISRSTVKELKNFMLKGVEFYGEPPDNPIIWNTALKSDLIIYEGHIEQFELIKEKGDASGDMSRHYQAPYFDYFPFMILQSCDSLKNHEILLDRGISGIIGSCSKVHSASGSATIKMLLDAMLYDGANYGEALRDAKNYSLSVVELKKKRGHIQQDKTLRSALTFRLMGDPQARLFFKKLPEPSRKPVKARFVNDQTVEITTPLRYYPEVKNKCYKLQLFPKAETAGIVSRSSNPAITMRCINPLYFFRLPLNQTQRQIGNFDFKEDHATSPRSINLTDPFGRWIYILHYPKANIRNRKIMLHSK